MIDHGVRGVMELDQHGFHPFLALQVAVTRKDLNGKVWGAPASYQPDRGALRVHALECGIGSKGKPTG